MPKVDSRGRAICFTDGASSGNPGPGGWGAVLLNPDGQVFELGGGETHTTNNRMELLAAICALEFSSEWTVPIAVYADSTYVIRGITEWVFSWKKRQWLTTEAKPVANADLWQVLLEVIGKRQVEWHYVKGHAGVPGNERVDQIAVAFSQKQRISLYQGSVENYDVDLTQTSSSIMENSLNLRSSSRSSSKSSVKSRPVSYLSLVGRTPMRHGTWAECEARVKGVPGAKFKKALNSDEEMSILESWGFSDKDISRKS